MSRALRSFWGRQPLQSSIFYLPKIKKQVDLIIAAIQPDHIYCQLARMAPYAIGQPHAKTIDYMDAFAVGMQKRAAIVPWWQRGLYQLEARRMQRYEEQIFSAFDHHTIISEQDAALINARPIHIVPNGIDLDFFNPKELSIAKSYDIAFVGNMGYLPNIAAAEYLVNQVLPLVQRKRPETNVLIAGARPDDRVKRLANSNVTVSGWMDDIREGYASSNLFVAPLFNGTGQQNKILEAMAMKVAVVTSSEVNQAIGATDGQSIVLADDASNMAQSILRLLNDDGLKQELQGNAHTFVHERYSWASQNKKLIDLITKA